MSRRKLNDKFKQYFSTSAKSDKMEPKMVSAPKPSDRYPNIPPPPSRNLPPPSHNMSPCQPCPMAPPRRPCSGRTVQRLDTEVFRTIRDQFHSVAEVQAELRRNGLENSNLVIGIDFTKSNEWAGTKSYAYKNLHHVSGHDLNPYEEAIKSIAGTLEDFDTDKLIPCYGFGDATANDRAVFSFYQGNRPAGGLDEVLQRYRQIVPQVDLAGPTSFAPLIRQAMKLVVESGNQYHILLILADGQVTRSIDTLPGKFSPQESATIDAIVEASSLPLSIVMVGLGDGPWDTMKEFDDALPSRHFDNFQFVNFTEIQKQTMELPQKQQAAVFALAALQEVPDQYRILMRKGLIGGQTSYTACQFPSSLPPPPKVQKADEQRAADVSNFQLPTSFMGSSKNLSVKQSIASTANSFQRQLSLSDRDGFVCPITTEVMDDPVIAADGNSYERTAIQAWLQKSDRSPVNGTPLEHKTLIPNRNLRKAIEEAREELESAAAQQEWQSAAEKSA